MRRQLIGLCLALLVLSNLHVCAAAGNRYTLITMLHTNDLHGAMLGETGGIARMATLVKQIRAEMPSYDQRFYTIGLLSSAMSDLLGHQVVTITSNPQITLREAVINYIRRHKVVSAPALGKIKLEHM